MKILHLDIETAPHTVHTWGTRKQNIALSQIIKPGYTLCWAAKWDGERKIKFSSILETTAKKMIQEIHGLISEADAVVHYNGNKFDMPTLNGEFLKHGLHPPQPWENIDLFRVCLKQFRLVSYKMDYLARYLGVGQKLNHKGHELWVECINGDISAWRTMKRYNIQDVRILEKIYHKLLAWIDTHPNHNVYNDSGERVCVRCGGKNIHKRGYRFKGLGKYERFRCMDCDAWMQGRFTQLSKETRATMLKSAS